MTGVLNRLWPSTVGSQMAWLIALGVGFTFVVYTFATTRDQPGAPSLGFEHAPGMVMDFAILTLTEIPEGSPERTRILEATRTLSPELQLQIVEEATLPDRSTWVPVGEPVKSHLAQIGAVAYTLGNVQEAPPPQPRFLEPPRREAPTSIGIGRQVIILADGTFLSSRFVGGPRPNDSPATRASSKWLLTLAIVLPLALFWAARSISAQLRRFAKAAEDFSIDGNHAPLEVTGPEEMRVTARALNRMRDRIAEIAGDRMRMLTAIGHDLRTPVTRMRLRAEFIKDEDVRGGMMQDIDRMETMIDSTLTFLREGRTGEARTKIDLDALLHTICDQFTDMGANLECHNGSHALIFAEESATRRAIENLVRNGINHAEKVILSLQKAEDGKIAVQVDDNGPGIPLKLREQYLKPFVAGDKTRSSGRNFGLGLSITNAIALAQGGWLELGDSELGGLCARIILPKATESAPARA